MTQKSHIFALAFPTTWLQNYCGEYKELKKHYLLMRISAIVSVILFLITIFLFISTFFEYKVGAIENPEYYFNTSIFGLLGFVFYGLSLSNIIYINSHTMLYNYNQMYNYDLF